MTTAARPELRLVKPEDDFKDQMGGIRLTAELIVQLPLDALAKRAEEERMHVILNRKAQPELDRSSCDNEIIAVLAFAQKRLKGIEARYRR